MIQVKAGQIFPWGEVLKTYCIHMSFFLLMYTVVIAAALMTGNTIVNVLGSAVFFLWGPGTVMLLIGYFSSYYITFYQDGNRFVELLQKSSPAAVYRSGIRTGKSRLNGAVGGCSNRTSYRALCISV